MAYEITKNTIKALSGAIDAMDRYWQESKNLELENDSLKANLKEAKEIIEHDAELLETLKKQVQERQAEANSYRDLYNELRSALDAKHTDSRSQVLKIAEELKANNINVFLGS